jgi:hypothetical protein
MFSPGLAFYASYSHTGLVTPDEILKFVQGAARLRQIRVALGHPTTRMQQRQAQLEDIREAILSATSAAIGDDGPDRWVIGGGRDLDGDPLTVVVKLRENTVWVVTVF